jgi:hypothetical protein
MRAARALHWTLQMRVALFLVCFAAAPIAHADTTFQDHDTFGLDVSTVWEPANRDAFGAGPVFRFEGFSSRFPDWLGVVTRGGLVIDNADRIFSTLSLGLMLRPSDAGIYATLEGGATINNETVMDTDVFRLDWTGAAAVGYRLGAWDVRAAALVGGLFERNAWMFSIGRDFVRVDSTITRTTL